MSATGDLVVTVKRAAPYGTGLADVTVKVFYANQFVEKYSNQTDNKGRAYFYGIAMGSYHVIASRSGFKTAERHNVSVAPATNPVSLHLQPIREKDKLYVCTYCGANWTGVTNRRAARPLDPEAVEAANKEVWDKCSARLGTDPKTGKGRKLTMGPSDYLCRRRWMDTYLAHARKKEQPKGRDGPIQPCPRDGTEKPKPPPPPPANAKCAIVSLSAACEHKDKGVRMVHANGTLEVVPTKTYGSDTIELLAEVRKRCGKHPVWEFAGKTENGTKQSFNATGPVTSKLWIPSFTPKKYEVSCTCCDSTQRLQVHAYPSNEIAVTVDLKKTLEIVRKITNGIEWALDKAADKFSWKYLEGKAGVQAAWKEHTDHRAFYAYDVVAKFDPLFGIELRITLGPGKIAKWIKKFKKLGKWVGDVIEWLFTAGLIVKFSGGIGADLNYKRKSPDQQKFTKNLGGGINGKIGVDVGVEAKALGKHKTLIGVELMLGGSVTGKGDALINDKGIGINLSVDFDGLKGTGKFCFLWGIIDVSESVTILDPQNIWGGPNGKDIYFFDR